MAVLTCKFYLMLVVYQMRPDLPEAVPFTHLPEAVPFNHLPEAVPITHLPEAILFARAATAFCSQGSCSSRWRCSWAGFTAALGLATAIGGHEGLGVL